MTDTRIPENRSSFPFLSLVYWNVPRVLVNNELRYRSVCALCGTEYFDFSSTPRDWILGEIETSASGLSGIMEWDAVLNDICLCICGDIASYAIIPVLPEFWRVKVGGDETGEDGVDMMEEEKKHLHNWYKKHKNKQRNVRRGGLTA